MKSTRTRTFVVMAMTMALTASSIAQVRGPLTPEASRRGTEQTFLTFPEWFLVFSPAEYAALVKTEAPDHFPFLGHIRQFWSSYGSVANAANDGHPFNFGYHAMIVVIGTSTTVEYLIKSAYETVIGRVARATHFEPVDEDRFAARFAQDYVDFIRVRPWYEYNFDAELTRLWAETPLTGRGMIRRWERKYILTTEFIVKAIYGRLIGGGTHASYEAAVSETFVVTRSLPDLTDPRLKDVRLVDTMADGSILSSFPRYQAFTQAVTALADKDIAFEEIAGNRDVILVTTIRSETATTQALGTLLFSQPIITRPGRVRLALVVPVAQLSAVVKQLTTERSEVEHIYDY
ncbi:MAG: hypothetical protein ABI672_06810 [Vicinamibacteria bacterium]